LLLIGRSIKAPAMVVRDQDLDANIVRWGLHHLLDSAPSGICAHRPQPPTTDYAPPPQTQHALLGGGGGGPGHCAHRPQTPTTDYAPQPPPQTMDARLDGAPTALAAAEVRIDAVENDEVIAHALQEELAQVARAEAEGASCSADAVLAQQWFRPEVVSYLPSGDHFLQIQHQNQVPISFSLTPLA
jgi:hypothetical protein